MKQRRKAPAPRKPCSEIQDTVKNPKRPAISQSLIEVPAGEDQTSFERHNRLLEIEYSKTKERNGCKGIDEIVLSDEKE